MTNRTAVAPAFAARIMDRHHDAAVVCIDNLMHIAEAAIEMGDVAGAKAALAEAQPFIETRDKIRSCMVPKVVA